MVRRGTQHVWLVLLALAITSVVARGEEPEKAKDAVHIGLVNTAMNLSKEGGPAEHRKGS